MGVYAQDANSNTEHNDECYNKLIISPDSKSVAFFSYIMILFAAWSTFFGGYFACHGEPNPDTPIAMFDGVLEVCFVLDMIKTFFVQYTDPRFPRSPIKDLAKIVVHYLKGAFIFDFIACCGFPLRLALRKTLSK